MASDAALTLRLVSINIWDLPIPLPGIRRRLRRRRLLRALPALDPDILLVQEAFIPRFRHRIAAVLPDHYMDPLCNTTRRHGLLRMDATGGMVTFSRWPILRAEFQPTRSFPGMKPDERVGRKGCLWVELDTPAGHLMVGNVHCYAGPLPIHARVRAVQARQLAARAASIHGPLLIGGDFNMAMEHEAAEREINGFDVLREAGFHEAAEGRSAGIATMAPSTNKFARYMPWHRHVDRRLTQVFYRGPGLTPARPPRLCLDQPPVSDHLGLLAEFRLTPVAD
ncbi:MAG TPA: endonuclease/exonuclease/phosphatase family protein [Gemmatimonadales bacterium]|nr:endonuclease/exonuclease/phosphatase family protein [Gemmatimonadales bacterium]